MLHSNCPVAQRRTLPHYQLADYLPTACADIWSLRGQAVETNPLYWLRTIDCADRLMPVQSRAEARALTDDNWQNAFRRGILLADAKITPPERRAIVTRLEALSAQIPAQVRPVYQIWHDGQALQLALSAERQRYSKLQQTSDSELDALRQQQQALQTQLDLTTRKLESLTDIERQLSTRKPAGNYNADLVISDLRMDEMDGMQLFTEIQKVQPGMPVIILTAHGSIPDAVAATQKGVFSFLTKPIDRDALYKAIDEALEQSAPATDDSWRNAIVTRSPLMLRLLEQARMVAQSDVSVLINGQSGTGKEIFAQAIHNASPRSNKPFVAINCGALPEQLLESELFGHARGAFTGAVSNREGLFQAAEGGTLFLDEIGDMPAPLQVKLLRVLQERKVRPLGSNRDIDIDVRIISATHRDLPKAMAWPSKKIA